MNFNLPELGARVIKLIRIASLMAIFLLTASIASAQTFTLTGSMEEARAGQTETLLPDGKVLIAGGAASASAELYDPAAGAFSPTGSMHVARYNHTATLLNNGKVLIQGGTFSCFQNPPAELYDPATGVFTETGSTTRKCDSLYATATLLANGKVLIAGGDTQIGPLDTAELYDPATGAFTLTGSMTMVDPKTYYSPYQHTATLLGNGKVLIAGGDNWFDGSGNTYSIAELYDPATGTFSAPIQMVAAHAGHTATLLANGKVLIAGGYIKGCCGLPFGALGAQGTSELFDSATASFSGSGNLNAARYFDTAAVLPDREILIAGGTDFIDSGSGQQSGGTLASGELYNPFTGVFSPTGSMNTARLYHAAGLLDNGQVLVTGDEDSPGTPLPSAELYSPSAATPTPGPTPTPIPTPTPTPGPARAPPQTLSFGRHKSGTLSASQVAVISNPLGSSNKAPIELGDFFAMHGPFQIDPAKTTCARGLILARGKSCRIGVQFAPTTTGRLTATLIVNDTASNGPQTVQLRGTGM